MPSNQELIKTVRNPWWQVVGLLAVIAMVLVALFGGFRRAPAKVLAPHAAGERVATAALAVTVQRAWIDSRNVKSHEDSFKHQHFLVLDAVVENLTDKSNSWYLPDDLRRLSIHGEQDGVKPDIIYLAEDQTYLTNLQPHLPTHVLLEWKIAPDQPVPAQMRWGLYGRHFVAKTYLTTESGWLQGDPAATFTSPVEDRRGSKATTP